MSNELKLVLYESTNRNKSEHLPALVFDNFEFIDYRYN